MYMYLYLYLEFKNQYYLYLYLYLDPNYLNNTKYIQVQTSTLYLIKNYIDSSELCDDTIGKIRTLSVMIL